MLIDECGLRRDLQGFAADNWINALWESCMAKLGKGAHGDLERWQQALSALPKVTHEPLCTNGIAVGAEIEMQPDERCQAYEALQALAPWRKGPFSIGDVLVDSEWRSELKWQRIANALDELQGKRVLDVGCGNGYYALRMALRDARLVIGVDPTLLFLAQFAAVRHFLVPPPVYVLPLRLQEVPQQGPKFDVVISMGVLYHQRNPGEHLLQLKGAVEPSGTVLLETLILPGDHHETLVPEDRYARMRNVWHLPTRTTLLGWLDDAGFSELRVVDQTRTTTDEQRSTEWMPFESLREALNPADPMRTIEGLPGPLRIVVSARRQ